MALVDMRNLLQHAYDNNYAVGSFAIVDLNMLEAIITAAERCRAPVILALSEPLSKRVNLAMLAPAIEHAAMRAKVPVAIHFDHGSSEQSVAMGISMGCNSVMIDGSQLPLNENLQLTRSVVEMAHAVGVSVEAELGYVPVNGGEEENDQPVYTTVEEARGFVKRTEVDFLAVSVGTVHGKSNAKTKLDYQRLRQINEALNIPLVLHGSSGLSDDKFRRLIANGIAKINFFSALTSMGAEQIKDKIAKTNDYLELHEGVAEGLADEVERCMRVWGSAGRAAEILAQCRTWQVAECLIAYSIKPDLLIDPNLFIERGADMLKSIPGVRSAEPAFTTDANAEYSHWWKVSFIHPHALTKFFEHPAYEDFIRRYLSQVADKTQVYQYQLGTPASALTISSPVKEMAANE